MYKVIKRDCPVFGIGPYTCEFICDTASDISTLPTSISEGTGGKSAYDNQKCASGSIAIVVDNGAESKRYMLNNQDIWCPYSVVVGSSGGSSESSITVDFALSETSENPVANKVIVAALDDKANVDDIPNIKVNEAVNADTVNGHSVNADVPENAKFTDTIPDLSPYALKSKYGDTTINVGRKDGTTVGRWSTAEGYYATASGDYSHAEGASTTASDSCSHAEGYLCTASSDNSHAEGNNTTASGAHSHSEGDSTTASGIGSHSGGASSTASGDYSFSHGFHVESNNSCEVSLGKFNKSSSDTRFSIGDGTSDTARHNAFEITTTGGKLHDKDIATTDIIPDLSAYAKTADVPNIKVNEAVNADTLGGIQAVDFRQITSIVINTLPTPPSSEGDYFVSQSDSSFPYTFGNLSIRYGSYAEEFVAIYQTTGNDQNIWFNVYRGGWTGWRRINDGGNADTLDGMHADSFAKANSPSIEGEIRLLRSGNAATKGSIFAWEETVRIRNEDPNAENTTYTDLIVTPDGIYTESTTNGVIKGRTKIESGKPYITGSATVAANSSVCVSNHGFTPCAVVWWDGSLSGVAVSFSDTQFVIDKTSAVDRTVNYLMFK